MKGRFFTVEWNKESFFTQGADKIKAVCFNYQINISAKK
jgi:hypothetical protein